METQTEKPAQDTSITGAGDIIPGQTRSKYTIDDNILCHELRRKLWEGQLPIKIELSIKDVLSIKMPASLYLMAPRENYFFYILTQVKQAFDNYAPPDKLESYDDMWFECNGKPLKWNLPIGVQFDSLVGLSGKQEQLPWTLTFHYKESPLPKQHLFRAPNQAYQYTFMQSLKEALSLRVGDANEILQHLSQTDQNKMLLDGLFKHNYETFWEINQTHLLRPIADFKRFAIRVLSNAHHTYVQLNQKVVEKPINSEGENVAEDDSKFKDWEERELKLTIGDVLMDAFPALFSQNIDDESILISKPELQVLTHGVPLNLRTAVYWMQLNLSYPDGFVYLSFNFTDFN